MSNAVNSMVRFSRQTAEVIEQTRQEAQDATVNIMNDLALEVVDGGGYCDDKTFATVFFGGIDPEMSWDVRFANERLAAPQLPDEFKQAQRIGRVVSYSCFEPFVAKQSSFDGKDDIGIVMPGVQEYDYAGFGFKIHDGRVRYEFIGQMVFKGFSKIRDYRPYDEHVLFNISRHKLGLDIKHSLDTKFEFGVAAVRQHVFPDDEFLSDTERHNLDNYIDALRTTAKQHIQSAK